MTHFLVFATAYAFMFSIRSATLTEPIRQHLMKVEFLRSMLSCSFCTGFWASLASSYAWGVHTKHLLLWSFAGATVCMVIDVVLVALETYTDSVLK